MRSFIRVALPLLIAAAAFVIGVQVYERMLSSGQAVAYPVGSEAPEISGEDSDGQPFRLSDYRGKVVLLSFWHRA